MSKIFFCFNRVDVCNLQSKPLIEINTQHWALSSVPRKFHVLYGHQLTTTLKRGNLACNSERLSNLLRSHRQPAELGCYPGFSDMQTVILIIVLRPPLSEESRSYMLTTCMHFGVLDYERTFLKTQPRKDLALLLEYQK